LSLVVVEEVMRVAVVLVGLELHQDLALLLVQITQLPLVVVVLAPQTTVLVQAVVILCFQQLHLLVEATAGIMPLITPVRVALVVVVVAVLP
jgi:hypothetical protein